MAKEAASTNGTETTAASDASILAKIRSDWKKGGEKDPPEETVKKLIKSYKEANAKTVAAETALNEAKAVEEATVLELAKIYGANSLKIGGVVHEFACRGGRVFFRKRTANVIEIND